MADSKRIDAYAAESLRRGFGGDLILILQFTSLSPHGTSLKMAYDANPASESWAEVAVMLEAGVKDLFTKILSELNGRPEPEPIDVC